LNPPVDLLYALKTFDSWFERSQEWTRAEFFREGSDALVNYYRFLAEEVNAKSENIGARRLHTIMEKVLEDISFDADEHSGETITIDEAYVNKRLSDVVQDQDLSRYIL